MKLLVHVWQTEGNLIQMWVYSEDSCNHYYAVLTSTETCVLIKLKYDVCSITYVGFKMRLLLKMTLSVSHIHINNNNNNNDINQDP